DDARQNLLRALRTGNAADLCRGELPQAAGIRDPGDARAGYARATGDGAGRRQSLVVADAHDVRAARRRIAEQRRADGVEGEGQVERPAPAALRGSGRAASEG